MKVVPQLSVTATATALWLLLATQSGHSGFTGPLLMIIGGLLGITLYHSAFGFSAAYRNWFSKGETGGIRAQVIMLAAATILFTPILASGEVFGHAANGIFAPLGWRLLIGAFLFGIGMQLGGGCGSGTLFTAGGGNLRMVVTLIFFCAGSWWATLDMTFWQSLPSWPVVSLGREIGWLPAAILQLSFLAALWFWLKPHQRQVANDRTTNLHERLLQGPWPMVIGALLLAFLNWAVLLTAGHPWTVTWAFAVWGAKVATLAGWDPTGSAFWSSPYAARQLGEGLLIGHSSITDIGILFGALIAASLAGRFRPGFRMPLRSLLAAMLGGLMLGYGARVGFGCNIGAFFSGVASLSLHGWGWIIAALGGSYLGMRLRPLFGLAN